MVVFTCTALAKSYGERLLFEDVSFGMETGEKIGIIGRNGVGKTTLMRIIAGQETPDRGQVAFNASARFEFLEQLPRLHGRSTALQSVMDAQESTVALLDRYAELCRQLSREGNPDIQRELDDVSHAIEHADGWALETQAKIILHRLGMDDFHASTGTLSGGQRKRVALARALLSKPDLLILDEPTNHLDADSVQWLQDHLQQSQGTLLFVTHDRYFLDAIVTRIVEIDQRTLFSFPGDFAGYLERKEAAVSAQEAEADHVRNRLRTELAWLQRGARARRTKSKSRIDWIARMQAQEKKTELKDIRIEIGGSFLGSRIIDAVNIGKSIDGKVLFRNFTHTASAGERIGIIGPNGCGKSTLLNVLAGLIPPDTGSLKLGETVRIGYFRQESIELNESNTVLGSVREVAEYIDTGVGRDRYLSARDMLDRFLFPPKQHSALVRTLSGGERRRLALLLVLITNPNVLLLDEPTNDFDIDTLTALEEYLRNFLGFLLIVSHDRSFLDRTIEYIYAFEQGGAIKQYPGNYSAYLERLESSRHAEPREPDEKQPQPPRKERERTKLSWQEERELEAAEKSIGEMEARRSALHALLHSGAESDYLTLARHSVELAEIEVSLDAVMLRWMELTEKREKLASKGSAHAAPQ